MILRLIATPYHDIGSKLEIVYLERQNVALSITKLKNDLCRCKFAHLEYQKFVFWPDLERLTPFFFFFFFFLYTDSDIIMAILWALIGSFLSLYT